jgi:predicted N-acetyltransferase YhbS
MEEHMEQNRQPEGPRALKAQELGSLGRLVDTVFNTGKTGEMQRMFPELFNESNLGNLIVFADGNDIVCHFGMTERWACLAGCTVGVACVGAVATCESHRGLGLATQAFQAAQAKADKDGVDFMLISGGRGLYRRAGAADVGLHAKAMLDRPAAEALAMLDVALAPLRESDLPMCVAAYARKATRFIRPAEDWAWFLQSRSCMCRDTTFTLVRDGDAAGAYLAWSKDEDGCIRVMEFGGESAVAAAALAPLMDSQDATSLEIHLQCEDSYLSEKLCAAGAHLKPVHAPGTLLLLNFPRLMERLRPYFEARAGRDAAKCLSFREHNDVFTFRMGQEERVIEGRTGAAELIFGCREGTRPEGALGDLFPVPALYYGLNYI